MTLTDEGLLAIRNAHEEEYGQYCDQDDFLMVARAIIAARDEELRKQEPHSYSITDKDGCEIVRLAKYIKPERLIAVKVKPLYTEPIPPTDEIVEIKRQRDSAIDSLRWIHNSSKTGASIDVICGYAKGAIREIEGGLK